MHETLNLANDGNRMYVRRKEGKRSIAIKNYIDSEIKCLKSNIIFHV